MTMLPDYTKAIPIAVPLKGATISANGAYRQFVPGWVMVAIGCKADIHYPYIAASFQKRPEPHSIKLSQ
jgi:hypothetical protein